MRRLLLLFALLTPMAGCYQQEECFYQAEAPADAIAYRNPETGLCQALGGSGSGSGSCDDWGGTPAPQQSEAAALPAWAECSTVCDGLDEDACLAAGDCRAAYITECAPGADCTEPEPAFLGCWGIAPIGASPAECAGLDAFSCSAQSDCVAVHYAQSTVPNPGDAPYGPFAFCGDEPGDSEPDWGSCTNGSDVTCDALPPECPADTLPGIRDGCWTGYCIPVDQCEDLPACAGLVESSCVARSECAPIYEGVDCTCDDVGCSCADWLFSSCEENQP